MRAESSPSSYMWFISVLYIEMYNHAFVVLMIVISYIHVYTYILSNQDLCWPVQMPHSNA